VRGSSRALALAAVVSCWTAALAGAAVQPNPGGLDSSSSNWAGYSVTGSGGHRSIGATWVQPAAACSSTDTWSSFWVGIDGDGSPTVEQIGTTANCRSGVATYSAWYELYPKQAVVLRLTIRAGDTIAASVTTGDGRTFSLTLTDQTTHKSKSVTRKARGARGTSAEAIVEAPSNGGPPLPLTSFGTIGFDDVWVDGSALGTLAPDSITMRDHDVVKATPSSLSSPTSFTVTWRHA
jgi:hypothetical protein